MNKQDSGNWQMKARLLKYHEDITPFAKEGREADFHKLFKPYEVIEQEGNCLLNTGINEMWDIITGVVSGVEHVFTVSAAYVTIGVGESTTEAGAGDTDLKGASKTYKGMETGYPTSESQKATFKSSFGSGDANYAWNEWVVKHATSNVCLNRKVESLGTKSTGTWTLEKLTGAFARNCNRITGLIRGKLNLIRHANPELSLGFIPSKCVETIYPAPFMGGEIVQAQ